MADRDNTPSNTGDPASAASTNETARPSYPSPQEVQEVAQRMLDSLTEYQRSQIRKALMVNMSEEKRREAAAAKRDPLIQYIFQNAKSDIMNRNLPAQVDAREQVRQQHQRLAPSELQSLIALQQGLPKIDFYASLPMIARQRPCNGSSTAAATMATSSSQNSLAANIKLHLDGKCANCDVLPKQRHIGHVNDLDEQGKE